MIGTNDIQKCYHINIWASFVTSRKKYGRLVFQTRATVIRSPMESEKLPVPEKSSLLCAPNRDSLATWVEKYGRSQGI